MDKQNPSTSVDSLFKDNAGGDWIVTEIEKGKLKLARCEEDEIDEFYTSRADWLVKTMQEDDSEEEISDRPHNWQLHGDAMFLIRDLLNCEMKHNYFICKKVPFLDVLLCANVVSLHTHSDKYVITVDDGTSSIMCMINQEDHAALQVLDEETKKEQIELTEALKANPNDARLKWEASMMSWLRKLATRTCRFEQLKLGDTVTIKGTLSEHNNKRYIFIRNFEREPEDSLFQMRFMKDVLHLYKHHYSQA